MLGRQLFSTHLSYIQETPEAAGIEFVNGDAPEAEAAVSRRDCCTTRTHRLTGRIEGDSHS